MEKGSVGIHDGTFHADEVTACALLIVFGLASPQKIVRTRDHTLLEKCEYVCDVGGIYNPARKLFDHHQSEYSGDLSSAGMILLYLRETNLISADVFNFLHHALVKGVDDHDNGRAPQIPGYCSFSHVIANFNPIAYDSPDDASDKCFHQALEFATGHLKRLLMRYEYNISCRKVVEEVMKKSRYALVFDTSIAWLESFFALGGKNHPALFVVMPAKDHWKLRAIPPDYDHRMDLRTPLPKEWAGLLDEDLKKASGIKGAVFCHKGRFTSVWETKEDALQALKMALAANGIKE